MSVSQEYLEYVLEQLTGVGRVTSRRMFGGVGLYCDDLFFALLSGDALYFKVDDSNRADYVARGARQFRPFPDRPDGNKPNAGMSYYELPADALEDARVAADHTAKLFITSIPEPILFVCCRWRSCQPQSQSQWSR